jgi:hypothetical protein
MVSSGMLRCVALVRTNVSEERNECIIRVTRIGEKSHIIFLRGVCWLLVTANVISSSSIIVTLMMQALCSSETRVLKIVTRGYISEDGII